jgi:hypothetical protein
MRIEAEQGEMTMVAEGQDEYFLLTKLARKLAVEPPDPRARSLSVTVDVPEDPQQCYSVREALLNGNFCTPYNNQKEVLSAQVTISL